MLNEALPNMGVFSLLNLNKKPQKAFLLTDKEVGNTNIELFYVFVEMQIHHE